MYFRGIRKHIDEEWASITLAREFLRKERTGIRHRESAYQAQLKEYQKDLAKHQLSVSNVCVLFCCCFQITLNTQVSQNTDKIVVRSSIYCNSW